MEDFIRIWDNAVDDKLCDKIIKFFDDTSQNSPSSISDEKTITKSTFKDYFSCFIEEDEFQKEIWGKLSQYVNIYLNEFGHLKTLPLVFNGIKIKKINPYGGYHIWHYESNTSSSNGRELVWMLYLNNMPINEAETEFLYQKRKIQPIKKRLVIFPACLTHLHRGLTVYTHAKYIVSGWIYRDYNKQLEMNE